MNKLYKLSFWVVASIIAMAFAACSGSSEDGDSSVDDGILRIAADRTEITANGVDKVVFAVKLGNRDVSKESTMTLILVKEDGDTRYAGGINVFSTTKAGTYVFKARFYEGDEIISENSVTITAKPAAASKYYHKLLGMQFTSVGCQNCPMLSEALKNMNKEYPDRIAVVSFHQNFGNYSDPMRIAATDTYRKNVFGNFQGLPRFFFNLRNGDKEIINQKDLIVDEMNSQLLNYPVTCGVAIASTYNAAERKVNIKAMITSDVTNSYRCLIFLVEDGIAAFQINGGDNYIHNNVVRALVSSSIYGEKFSSETKVGEEMKMERSYTLGAGWNPDNMRVVVAMLTTLDGGTSYTVNNVNECKLGASVDYLYNKE